jgi:penicillin-binding protein 1A
VRDPFQSTRKRRHVRLIEVDAWIDSTVFRAGRFVVKRIEGVSLFMRRFKVSGFTRAVVEVLGDGMTLAVGGVKFRHSRANGIQLRGCRNKTGFPRSRE